MLPTARVEYALRGDDVLNEADVRELMQTYVALRTQRIREANGNGHAQPETRRPAQPRRLTARPAVSPDDSPDDATRVDRRV